ncbi:hypothetical protein [Leadbetterella byssophila]|uniref:hypothetical protein n=1 Tax=Leadbetterella byssophila TaxID=316068 RepID=UPI0039A0439A
MNTKHNLEKSEKALRIGSVVRCLISFFNYWGTANWYQGIDKPTLWQRIYKWRISPKTAWTLAKGIWLDGYSK